jgi:Arc/MetJ-type ribon-helix-helix transcriptional regulator
MVSFRLTEEQYEDFRRLCEENSCSSVSEMARTAIMLMLGRPRPSPEQSLESRVTALEHHFKSLATAVRRLQNEKRSGKSSAAATGGA